MLFVLTTPRVISLYDDGEILALYLPVSPDEQYIGWARQNWNTLYLVTIASTICIVSPLATREGDNFIILWGNSFISTSYKYKITIRLIKSCIGDCVDDIQ